MPYQRHYLWHQKFTCFQVDTSQVHWIDKFGEQSIGSIGTTSHSGSAWVSNCESLETVLSKCFWRQSSALI